MLTMVQMLLVAIGVEPCTHSASVPGVQPLHARLVVGGVEPSNGVDAVIYVETTKNQLRQKLFRGAIYDTVKSGIFDGFFDVFLIFLKNEHDKPIGTPNRGL